MAHLKNKLNEYATLSGDDLFEKAPKSVWAALAVSFASRNAGPDGESLDGVDVRRALLDEWKILHEQGIVPQKPNVTMEGR